MEQQLLTMAQIAKELNLAESTARFYRDRFEDFIPFVGEGRKKRYKPETVDVLRFIAEGFNRNLTAIDIENGLSRMFAMNIEAEKETVTTTAVAQQQSNSDTLQIVLEQMSTTMRIIAEQKEDITELRKHIAVVEKRQQDQQEYIDSLKEHDKTLMRAIREAQEVKKMLAAAQQKKWWQFWK